MLGASIHPVDLPGHLPSTGRCSNPCRQLDGMPYPRTLDRALQPLDQRQGQRGTRYS